MGLYFKKPPNTIILNNFEIPISVALSVAAI